MFVMRVSSPQSNLNWHDVAGCTSKKMTTRSPYPLVMRWESQDCAVFKQQEFLKINLVLWSIERCPLETFICLCQFASMIRNHTKPVFLWKVIFITPDFWFEQMCFFVENICKFFILFLGCYIYETIQRRDNQNKNNS